MAKFPTFPTLYDSVLKISMSKLISWGYLKPNQIINSNMNWSRNGIKTAEIGIYINTNNEYPFIELNYKFKDEPRNYRIDIVSINSNLGKGKIYYFVCPHTKRRCRNLYLISGYFYHRLAFVGCMYDCQTQSKKYRSMSLLYGSYFELDRLYEHLYKKHLKKTYAGKPTKRYLKLTKQIEWIERSSKSYDEFERLLLK